MNIRRTNPNATVAAYIMISSFLSTPWSRSGGAVAAVAFRHASIASPVVLRPHHCVAGEGSHRRGTRGRRRMSGSRPAHSTYPSSSSPSALVPRPGSTSTGLYDRSDGGVDGGGGGAFAAIGDDASRASDATEAEEDSRGGGETWRNHRSRWARRKHRKRTEGTRQERGTNGDAADDEGDAEEGGGLDWETFEFGTSPKMDVRFDDGNAGPGNETGISDHVLNTVSTDSVTYKTYLQSEANLDEAASAKSVRSRSELASLSPEIVRRSIDVLRPYVQPRRLERIDRVLGRRTRHARFLFENPSNPSNVWACLRTLDSFGIQYVDVIVHSDSYKGKAAVNQKRGMRTAMGSAMWMTIRQFGSIDEAVRSLREEEGCLIYASDLNPDARDVRDLTWDVDFDGGGIGDESDAEGTNGGRDQRPICIVMGNEDRGISDEMRDLADETFYLPMCGFAESFNLSVATAVTLAYMSAVSGGDGTGGSADDGAASTSAGRRAGGPLRPGNLDPHELQRLRLRGVLNSLAQRRMGKALLKKEGIVLPESMFS